MNYVRLGVATVGAFVAYMGVGGLMFVLMPFLKQEFLKYPAVYRSHEGQMEHLPIGMAAILLSILVLTVLYARLYRRGSGLLEGAAFGALIGLFAIGAFVLHNYANLNIGLKLTTISALAYFVEWCVVGIVIGLIYKPSSP
jgi:membrane associated rhomboid family serine protease